MRQTTKVATLALGTVLAACASPGGGTGGGQPADASGGDPGMRTVLAGVYTEAQATRGQQEFQQSCSSCHAVTEFSGPVFQRIWAGRPVGELYEFISTMMPESDPGGLTAQEYTDVLAYVLRQNQYPAGDTELPADGAALRAIVFQPVP